ncbi:uncharacterized protein LOC117302704 [Asterias rubens]|uniref:uncharacterized protein LOC117302704 n=1 Tax=Asterias rubens TaxID=7604 RepID=UPI0014552975|nr:uncharacterized protein LOC117302704 [Asterias rubens]
MELKVRVCNPSVLLSQVQKGNLSRILPSSYNYCICEYRDTDTSRDAFLATLGVNIKTKPDASKWLQQFQKKSMTTMRVSRTWPQSGPVNIFKKRFRCHHNTRAAITTNQKLSSKNTRCQAFINITVQKIGVRTRRKNASHCLEFPTRLRMGFDHNHALESADVLRHRDVCKATKHKFNKLFKAGHSPSSALEIHKYDMQCLYRDNYLQMALADRAVIPDVQWCYRLYYKTVSTVQRRKGAEELISDLQASVNKYNAKVQQPIITIKVTADNNTAVAMSSLLMQRVSAEFKQSGEMVFVNSMPVDRKNVHVFNFMTPTNIGGLPVGCLITTNKSPDTMSQALSLYKSLLTKEAFNGQGNKGPRIFIIDDSESQKSAVQKVFPDSQVILCAFSMLKTMWGWLWGTKTKHGIPAADRPHLFALVKAMLCAESPGMLEMFYQRAHEDNIARKFPKFTEYLARVFEKRNTWALCLMFSMPFDQSNTHQVFKAAMQVTKDKLVMPLKAFNVVQLVDFLVTRTDPFYRMKLTDAVNNKADCLPGLQGEQNVSSDGIVQLTATEYEVPGEKQDDTYTVNMELLMCTCSIGHSGYPCIHQGAVVKMLNLPTVNFISLDNQVQEKLHYIATGQKRQLSLVEPSKPRKEPPSELLTSIAPQGTRRDTHIATGHKRQLSLVEPSKPRKEPPSELLTSIAPQGTRRDTHIATGHKRQLSLVEPSQPRKKPPSEPVTSIAPQGTRRDTHIATGHKRQLSLVEPSQPRKERPSDPVTSIAPQGTRQDQETAVDATSIVNVRNKTETLADNTADIELEKFSNMLDNLKEVISHKVQTGDAAMYRQAVRAFTQNYESLTTDSLLISAMFNFGKV